MSTKHHLKNHHDLLANTLLLTLEKLQSSTYAASIPHMVLGGKSGGGGEEEEDLKSALPPALLLLLPF